jgi:hypothetical protein
VARICSGRVGDTSWGSFTCRKQRVTAGPLSTSPDLVRAATIAKPTTAVRKVGLRPRLLHRKLRNDLYVKTNYALPRIHPA